MLSPLTDEGPFLCGWRHQILFPPCVGLTSTSHVKAPNLSLQNPDPGLPSLSGEGCPSRDATEVMETIGCTLPKAHSSLFLLPALSSLQDLSSPTRAYSSKNRVLTAGTPGNSQASLLPNSKPGASSLPSSCLWGPLYFLLTERLSPAPKLGLVLSRNLFSSELFPSACKHSLIPLTHRFLTFP